MKRIPILKDGITVTVVGEEYVLFPSYINEKSTKISSLNKVGYYIITLIDGKRTLEEIAKTIATTYKIDISVAQEDMMQFLTTMEVNDIIFYK